MREIKQYDSKNGIPKERSNDKIEKVLTRFDSAFSWTALESTIQAHSAGFSRIQH
jgi:hypothetical protein